MEDSESNSNNFSFSQSFNKEKYDKEQNNNSQSIRSFISKNYSYQSKGNSNSLEDIIFKKLKENEKSYLNNGIYFKRKIEGSNPNTKRGKENSLFNSNTFSEKENNNISRSDQLLDMHKHSIYKSFNQNNINQYSPNKNYIPDSESDEEKEEKNDKESENESIGYQSKKLSNNNEDSISIRISNPKDININNSSKKSSNKIFNNSQNEMISSLKNIELPIKTRSSVINNFSKLNSILSSRNTISYLEKPNYQLLAYTMFNKSDRDTIKTIRNTISSKKNNESINYVEQARIIQKWWRNIKSICDDKLKKIIKIQSCWRGRCSRKYMCEIIYLCYSCQSFYDIISKVLMNKARKLFLGIFFYKFNKKYNIIENVRKLFNRYQYLKPYFEKWKCLIKLLLFRNDINEENISTQSAINIKDSYDKNKNNENNQINKIEEKYLKLLYLDSIYLKFRINRIRYAFDCLNNYIFCNNINLKKSLKISNTNDNNNSFLRYILYKWRYIVKKLEINNLKEKLLKYIIIKISKKSFINILFKYFSRWKLITDDEKNKSEIKNKIRKGKKEKTTKYKKLKELIKLSIKLKRINHTTFIRALIRKWRFLIFAKKFASQKIQKINEVVQKTYGKIYEDIDDIDKIKLEKYKILNNNNHEDEKIFIEHMNKIYNGKMNIKFKYNFHQNNNK